MFSMIDFSFCLFLAIVSARLADLQVKLHDLHNFAFFLAVPEPTPSKCSLNFSLVKGQALQ